jgi:hypothetical protein
MTPTCSIDARRDYFKSTDLLDSLRKLQKCQATRIKHFYSDKKDYGKNLRDFELDDLSDCTHLSEKTQKISGGLKSDVSRPNTKRLL